MARNGSWWIPLGTLLVSALALILWAEPVRHSQSQPKANSLSHLPGQSSTLLPSGELLLLGGEGSEGPVADAGIENPGTGVITPLAVSMVHARAWHTATVLPNGTVLIFGGVGSDAHLVAAAETFDPKTNQFMALTLPGAVPRAHHTATLLTDGTVFLAGGLDDRNRTLGSAQVWNPRTMVTKDAAQPLIAPRSDQTATLQPNGNVLLWGGKDDSGSALNYGEVFDSAAQTFQIETTRPTASVGPLAVAATVPEDGTGDVASDTLIAIRFSVPVTMRSANASSITLVGPNGNVNANVDAAEAGMLTFVTPTTNLASGTTYTVELRGLSATDSSSISDFSFGFTTAEGKTSPSGNVGLPTSVDWSGGPQNSPYTQLSGLQAPSGVTAISGQVLLQNGLPLSQVTLRVGSDNIKTDKTGRFLLQNVASGHDILIIDGRTASSKAVTYGVFPVGVDVTANQTNALGYTIWMPIIDTAHAVTIPVPTTQETVITSPLISGLELHLPAGATITDIDGTVVNQVSITPIPVSQPPFPLPNGVQVPTYFTIQPGGGWISVDNATGPQGGWLVYPNADHALPGTRFNFWNYDAEDKGWYVYGHGTVTPDGQSVVPDPGVVIYALTGAMVASPAKAPTQGPCDCSEEEGDPVDLGTGLFVYRTVDLYEPDVIPIVLTRTYLQGDPATRDFGVGTQNSYDIYLVGGANPWSYASLVLSDGSEVPYTRISAGTSYLNGVFQAQSSGGEFFGSTINPCWALTRKDGTTYHFPCITNPSNYQADGLTSITDRNGNQLTITRGSNSNISKITSPNGRWIQFTYDSSNRVTQVQDQMGRTVSYVYDSSGRLTQVTDANGGLWKYTYDTSNRMTSITNPRNVTYLQNQYNTNALTQIHSDGGTYQFTFTYNATSDGVSEADVTDPNGNIRKVLFNPAPLNPSGFETGGTPSSITYAAGTPQQETFAYQYQSGTDLLASVTDPLNRTTSYTHDALGNITSVTQLSGTQNAVTNFFTYDPSYSQLTSITNPLGNVTNIAHDSKGNLSSITDPAGKVSTFTNDTEGRVLTATDPAHETTSYSYTSADLTSMTDALNRTTTFTYDGGGRIISSTSPMGHVTQYSYNALDQVTSITDPLQGVTAITYDGDRNLLTVTDPKNTQNPIAYSYDSMDRVQTRTDQLGHSESYVFDKKGNLTQFTDRRGKVTSYNYDPLDRRTFAGFGTQSGPTYESTVSYSYDLADRLTQATDSLAGTFARTYDNLSRLTKEQGPEGTVMYSYDAADRRTQMTVSGQASPVNYAYDADDHVIQISQGPANIAFGYDAANRRTSLVFPNGVAASYTYDSASELTGVNYQLPGSSLGNLTYTYDGDGRRTQISGTWARTGMPSPTTSTAVYNAANELTSWNSGTLAYDSNGNLISDGTNAYSWDARNQLSSITGGVSEGFLYDPFGRRLNKITNGVTTSFLYDGLNPVQELASGMVSANLLSNLNVDEYFSRSDIFGLRYFANDGLGSAVALTDASGVVQNTYTYDPFGRTVVQGGSTTNPYQYAGRENDGDGLYANRARYYNPAIGRFISEDPMADGEDLYAYVDDEPTDFTDPLGLQKKGGKPKAPKSQPSPTLPPDTAFYICCQNGTFGVCEGPVAHLGSGTTNPLYWRWHLECQKEHEQQHEDDFNSGKFPAVSPSYCQGQKNGTAVQIPSDLKGPVECSGYKKQLQCLQNSPIVQSGMLNQDINFAKDQCKHYCGNNQ